MTVKITLLITFFISLIFFYTSFFTEASTPETAIDKVWWEGLSAEWKTIFLINQNLARQKADIYLIQKEYINRLNPDKDEISGMNKSLHDLFEEQKFSLSYNDFYARAIRKKHIVQRDSIDLETLGQLQTLYIVGGPGDLSPLLKFPNLRVLIINYCGIGYDIPLKKQVLDLEPLRKLTNLQVLHCSSTTVKSLDPIRNLVNLEELLCDNTNVTTLDALKKLIKLRKLSFGANVIKAKVSHLENIEELYVKGCKSISSLSSLKRLKKLSIAENEYAIVNGSYRVTSLSFIKDLSSLEFLDLGGISYRGSLLMLNGLQNLKAVTLPGVNEAQFAEFGSNHKNCLIINSFEFIR